MIPRWGLQDRPEALEAQAPETTRAPATSGPSASLVRTTLFVNVLILAFAALVYVLRYVLLVFNRNTLLNSVVALAGDWIGRTASVLAILALIAASLVLIWWLIARRSAAFAHYALPEPRSAVALWAGCLVPFANLLWAPVYVIELAHLEDHYARLQRSITLWWMAWIFSYVVSIFAVTSSFATDSQGIANNTVLMVFAYLFAALAVASVARVFEGFERKPVHRRAHRWTVVDREGSGAPGSAAPVELDGQEPAA